MHSIRQKMIAVIACLSVITTFAILTSVWTTHKSEQVLQTILADRVIPLRDLKTISDAYAVDIVDTSHKVRGGSLSFREGISKIQDSEKIVDERWKAYIATYLTEEEKKLVAIAESTKKQAQTAVLALLDIMRDENRGALATFVDNKLYPAIEPATAAIDKLVNLQL
ncbi:MAG: MCP four helix bundle domain-containing protein [Beijerinckiaceae bacterium]